MGVGKSASIVCVKTETCSLVGSDNRKIAGPTMSIVTEAVPITIRRLPKAFRLLSCGLPS